MQDGDEISTNSYCRIQHVISGAWLHAIKGRTEQTND